MELRRGYDGVTMGLGLLCRRARPSGSGTTAFTSSYKFAPSSISRRRRIKMRLPVNSTPCSWMYGPCFVKYNAVMSLTPSSGGGNQPN